MVTITPKMANELCNIFEKSCIYAEAKKNNKDAAIRIGIIEDGSDFQYTLNFTNEITSHDVIVKHDGNVLLVFDASLESKLHNINIDYFDDGTRAGMIFKEQMVNQKGE